MREGGRGAEISGDQRVRKEGEKRKEKQIEREKIIGNKESEK